MISRRNATLRFPSRIFINGSTVFFFSLLPKNDAILILRNDATDFRVKDCAWCSCGFLQVNTFFWQSDTVEIVQGRNLAVVRYFILGSHGRDSHMHLSYYTVPPRVQRTCLEQEYDDSTLHC